MKSINLMFDASQLACVANKNSGRTGIYFVSYNICKRLINSKNVNLFFYCTPGSRYGLEIAIQKYFPEFKDIQIYPSRKFGVRLTNILYNKKIKYKQSGHKLLSKIFHLSAFLIKVFCVLLNLFLYKKFIYTIDAFLSPRDRIPKIIENAKNITKYTVLHDVIPFLFEEYYGSVPLWNQQLVELMKSNNTDYYFANSEYTKQDFLKLIPNLKSEQITTTLLACDESFKPCSRKQTEKSLKKYGLPTNKKYVFSLCSLEPRKNLIRAVKTFIKFIKKNKIDDLVFVLGGAHWDSFINKLNVEITDLGKYQDKIIKAGYIDDEDLAPLYSGAEWFVYTSQYEGFGLPPLEAMSCGCPVITSNNTSLPEVVGKAGIMIDWDSDEQHIKAYEKYYFDEKCRKKMAKAGLLHSKEYSWDKCVDIMLNKMCNKK